MFTVIYNPIAGNKKAKRVLPLVREELNRRHISHTILETVSPPDKAHYASVPCGDTDTVCVIGGDGTVLDVLNQLPGRNMHLITVPCGTGNDFIKCVHLPQNAMKAFRKQLDGAVRSIDYAAVSKEYFLNVFGVGFDVEVLKKLDQFKRKFSGLKAYLVALVRAIREYKPTKCLISIDGSAFRESVVSILSVGNGQFIGGGMKAVPSGDVFDGYLDVVEVKPVKKRQLLLLLPFFILGLHIKVGLAKTYRCKQITLQGDNLFYQIDGEIRSSNLVKIEVISNQLKFSF